MRQDRRLILVNPVDPSRRFGLGDSPVTFFPPLGLGIIAALTPKNWEVEILDENIKTCPAEDGDLVGITTSCTYYVPWAYALASRYREKGVPVVMGGMHASMLPEEALQYCDAVVIGEAESVWRDVINDFEKGRLRKKYRGTRQDLKNQIWPRRDLFHSSYPFGSLFTSRGCPMNCEFCSVSAFNGRKYRQRPVNDVLDELETIKQDVFMFVDDNIVGCGKESEAHALALFQGIIDRGIQKKWVSQASLNFAVNPDILRLASRSGCQMILLGVETDDAVELAEINKRLNLRLKSYLYEEYFRRVNDQGIAIWGSFLYGLDNDTQQSIRRRTEFIAKSRIDAIQITTLTPIPGTALGRRIAGERRLRFSDFPEDWKRYDFMEMVYHPRKITAEQYYQWMPEVRNRLFNKRALHERHQASAASTGNSFAARLSYGFNATTAKVMRCFEELAKEKPRSARGPRGSLNESSLD